MQPAASTAARVPALDLRALDTLVDRYTGWRRAGLAPHDALDLTLREPIAHEMREALRAILAQID